MELPTETVAERELSDYEIERDKPMPTYNHGKIQTRIGHLVLNDYEDRYEPISEPTLATPERPRTPDLGFFPVRPSDWFDSETKISEPPLGIVEIVSPSQSDQEMVKKLKTYFDFGVKSAWLVVPIFKTIYVFNNYRNYTTFTLQDGILKDQVLDIELNMQAIFK